MRNKKARGLNKKVAKELSVFDSFSSLSSIKNIYYKNQVGSTYSDESLKKSLSQDFRAHILCLRHLKIKNKKRYIEQGITTALNIVDNLTALNPSIHVDVEICATQDIEKIINCADNKSNLTYLKYLTKKHPIDGVSTKECIILYRVRT